MQRLLYNDEQEALEPDRSYEEVVRTAKRLYGLTTRRSILPPGLRWLNHDGVVFVRPPMTQLIEYAPTDKMTARMMPSDNKIFAEVNFPWSIYCIRSHYFQRSLIFITTVGFSNSDPIHADDIIYEIALPNLLRFHISNNNVLPSVCEANPINPKIGASFVDQAYEKTSTLWDSAWNDNAYRGEYHGDYLNKVGYASWEDLLTDLDGKSTSETVDILHLPNNSTYTHRLKDIMNGFFPFGSTSAREVKFQLQNCGLIEKNDVA